jgi:hypothetical protein
MVNLLTIFKKANFVYQSSLQKANFVYNENMNNKELLKKYPFLRLRNLMTGKYDRKSKDTWLDYMPDGWRKVFGEQMVEEIAQALKGEELLITQIKEKFGGLRFYCHGTTREVYDIIRKYERMSYHICISCGEPATKISKGWISPYCDQCAKQINVTLPDFMKVQFVPIKEYYKEYDHEMIEEEE